SPRAAVAATATRPSRLRWASPLARRAIAAVLPRRAGAAAPAAGLDPEPIRGGDGIAVGEHEVGPGVADFHGCDDPVVVEGRPQDGEPHRHVRPVAARLRRPAGLAADLAAAAPAA